jgi:hypothetical protein
MKRHSKVAGLYTFMSITLASSGLIVLEIAAQEPRTTPDNTQIATQISESRAKNIELLHHYSWTSRTEVKIKGEQKVLKSEAVHYSPDGKLFKAPLGESSDSGRKMRGVRKRVKERKTEQMRDWAGDLLGLLEKYSLPSAGNILDFINGAEISSGSRPGTTQIRGTNVVNSGDSLTLIVDSSTKALIESNVQTNLEGNLVKMRAVQRKLDSGLRYTAESVITVPGKGIEINVQNFSYTKN